MKKLIFSRYYFAQFMRLDKAQRLLKEAENNIKNIERKFNFETQLGVTKTEVGGEYVELGTDKHILARLDKTKNQTQFPKLFSSNFEESSVINRRMIDFQENQLDKLIDTQNQFLEFSLKQNKDKLEKFLDLRGVKGEGLEDKIQNALEMDEEKFNKYFIK